MPVLGARDLRFDRCGAVARSPSGAPSPCTGSAPPIHAVNALTVCGSLALPVCAAGCHRLCRYNAPRLRSAGALPRPSRRYLPRLSTRRSEALTP